MSDPVSRWRALADLGDPPKAPDLGLLEQVAAERLGLTEADTEADLPLTHLLLAMAGVERPHGRPYFGGGDGPSKGHLVTLNRYLDFWYADPGWTGHYLSRLSATRDEKMG